ncbi:SDR family oxidoreductase [Paraglaciecola arctica]|uniref:Short chain dehydrogenase n=1 Tax=Paraglaciecola arctica BSs20135 TaxID=493475 RepID=K6Z1T5_9ALTE|nr:SDR family oxidoreductase [Paraglaciecola arctica]GAC17415.1 short chain dehydrogenase [Paraglaciecola arctica BSs20135]|tara:strand:+ start:20188 stop:20997 length:810 start_codon:yes stop_codon:yes gene_type:complete
MNKNVLITGGASGLGEALALHYAKQNFEVCIADLNSERAHKVVDSITKSGGKAFFLPCDITNEADIETLQQQLQSRWSTLDVLVNNAGVATGGALEFEDIEQWEWVLNINVLGMVRMCRTFVPMMKQQSAGKIVNIASQAGITPAPLMGSYNASKAAVVSFSETMHLELADDNIHVSVACPGFFSTNLDESMRSKQPGVAKLVSKMLHNSSDITAAQVAEAIYQDSENLKFMTITHKDGRTAFRMKRWLAPMRYLAMMKKQLKNFKPRA